MSQKDQNKAASREDRHEEAKRLTEEALEEMKQGNKEEGEFVLEEARKLDPSATEEVLQDQKGGAEPASRKKS